MYKRVKKKVLNRQIVLKCSNMPIKAIYLNVLSLLRIFKYP